MGITKADLRSAKSIELTAQAVDVNNAAPKSPSNFQKSGAQSFSYDFVVLDGLRVAGCFAVMSFHSLLYWGAVLSIVDGEKLLEKHLPLRLAHFGNAGVDIFLVLTALWATYQLVPALEAAAAAADPATSKRKARNSKESKKIWHTIRQYYRKRVMRVLPAYMSALAIVSFAVDHSKQANPALRAIHDTVFEYCPQSLPLNFVLMNNLVGFGGCAMHFWSLAVQLHFYLAFPLLLWWAGPASPGFRHRIAISAILAFFATAGLRWGAAHAVGVTMPQPPYAHPDMGSKAADVAMRYYHTLYFSTPARIGNMATGVLLALFFLNRKAGQVFNLRSVRWTIGFACIATMVAFNSLVIQSKPFGGIKESKLWKHPLAFAALAYHGSPLYCAAVALLVLAGAVHAGPLSHLAAAVSNTRTTKNIAKLTYDIYLLHMVAVYWFEAGMLRWKGSQATLAAAVEQDPVKGYAAIVACTCVGGYVVALLHNKMHAFMGKVFGKMRSSAA